jgi:hypothetical protein
MYPDVEKGLIRRVSAWKRGGGVGLSARQISVFLAALFDLPVNNVTSSKGSLFASQRDGDKGDNFPTDSKTTADWDGCFLAKHTKGKATADERPPALRASARQARWTQILGAKCRIRA